MFQANRLPKSKLRTTQRTRGGGGSGSLEYATSDNNNDDYQGYVRNRSNNNNNKTSKHSSSIRKRDMMSLSNDVPNSNTDVQLYSSTTYDGINDLTNVIEELPRPKNYGAQTEVAHHMVDTYQQQQPLTTYSNNRSQSQQSQHVYSSMNVEYPVSPMESNTTTTKGDVEVVTVPQAHQYFTLTQVDREKVLEPCNIHSLMYYIEHLENFRKKNREKIRQFTKENFSKIKSPVSPTAADRWTEETANWLQIIDQKLEKCLSKRTFDPSGASYLGLNNDAFVTAIPQFYPPQQQQQQSQMTNIPVVDMFTGTVPTSAFMPPQYQPSTVYCSNTRQMLRDKIPTEVIDLRDYSQQSSFTSSNSIVYDYVANEDLYVNEEMANYELAVTDGTTIVVDDDKKSNLEKEKEEEEEEEEVQAESKLDDQAQLFDEESDKKSETKDMTVNVDDDQVIGEKQQQHSMINNEPQVETTNVNLLQTTIDEHNTTTINKELTNTNTFTEPDSTSTSSVSLPKAELSLGGHLLPLPKEFNSMDKLTQDGIVCRLPPIIRGQYLSMCWEAGWQERLAKNFATQQMQMMQSSNLLTTSIGVGGAGGGSGCGGGGGGNAQQHEQVLFAQKLS